MTSKPSTPQPTSADVKMLADLLPWGVVSGNPEYRLESARRILAALAERGYVVGKEPERVIGAARSLMDDQYRGITPLTPEWVRAMADLRDALKDYDAEAAQLQAGRKEPTK